MHQTEGSLATGFVTGLLGLLIGMCVGGMCCRKKQTVAKVLRCANKYPAPLARVAKPDARETWLHTRTLRSNLYACCQ